MKNLFFILVFFNSLFSFATTTRPNHFINSAYYAAKESKLFMGLSLVYEGTADKSGIYIYDTNQKKGEWIPSPESLASEHVIGIFPSILKNELYLLSQTRKAGSAKPSLVSFNYEKKTFVTIKSDLDCANVLDSKSLPKKLILKCGPDPHHSPKVPSLEVLANNLLALTTEKEIDWIPQKPNSMSEAKALVIKLPKERIRIDAESLFK